MEFVQFTDYGSPDNLDMRVVEGWGGVKDDTYYSSLARQGITEKQVQEEQNNFLLYYNPEGSNPTEKYFIKYPTNNDTNDEVLLRKYQMDLKYGTKAMIHI